MKKLFTMIMCTFLIFQSIGCGYAMANNNNTTKSVRRVRKRAKSKTSGIEKIVEVARIEAERDVKIAEIKHKNSVAQKPKKERDFVAEYLIAFKDRVVDFKNFIINFKNYVVNNIYYLANL